ncbi:sodium-dependent lysophosphatidylcholine symporter 1-A-like isoform X2 [Branchiostoma floridae x Branchiostoma belcheri]
MALRQTTFSGRIEVLERPTKLKDGENSRSTIHVGESVLRPRCPAIHDNSTRAELLLQLLLSNSGPCKISPLGLLLAGVLSRVSEIFAYPVFTILITRTNTRWGQLKPWILGCTLVMVPFYMLVWYVPDVAPGGKIAYFVALYIMESVLNSGVTLAHRTLVMYISDDNSDRESAIAFSKSDLWNNNHGERKHF